MDARRRQWLRSPARAELIALYAEADALLAGWTCMCSAREEGVTALPPCCRFAVLGREPHPTAVELEEVRHARKARETRRPGSGRRRARTLPIVDERRCPLLSREGHCTIYESRPFGCRTFFCPEAGGPFDSSAKLPRAPLRDIGRRIADLSARFAPHDPHPRPLVRALADEPR